MKIFSFNVNGIRARYHQLEKLISIHNPEVFCLQETKVHNDDFPFDALKAYEDDRDDDWQDLLVDKTEYVHQASMLLHL